MGKMNFAGISILFLCILSAAFPFSGVAQSAMPEALTRGTLKEQMDYIQEKTRIYEEFRAVREDMFQKIKNNALDSLRGARAEINTLKTKVLALNNNIDSLNSAVETARENLDKMTKTKNSINLLGIEVNKSAYNAVLWSLIAILAGLLAAGFLAYRRNFSLTAHTRKEFEELKKEFDAYRKASREAREKMSMSHFNELKKLRGA